MNDERLGIVRLPLPDGRTIPLQLTYQALDTRGHDWMLDQFRAMQKARTGSARAIAELLEVLSQGEVVASDVMTAPAGDYPLSATMKALWAAWEIAQYGPAGRPAEDGKVDPQLSVRQTWLKRLFGRRSGQAYQRRSSGS